jgi:hypothetical protein
MCPPDLVSFIRVESGVNAPIDNVGAALPRLLPDFISAKSICGVNSYSDDIARHDLVQLKPLERFVDKNGISELPGCCRRQNIEPTRSDDSRSKCRVARVYKIDLQGSSFMWNGFL